MGRLLSSEVTGLKRCNRCGRRKPLSHFYSACRGKQGKRAECRDCYRANHRISSEAQRAANIRYRWGLTVEEYDAILAPGCAICGQPAKVLDHDHRCCPPGIGRTCGKCIRGPLCKRCNPLVGYLEKNAVLLDAALAYLDGR